VPGATDEEPLMSTSTTVTGNLTRDPELRYTRDGHASTLLGLAVNRRWENRETREWEESTSFFDVVCWRELAENAALSLAKGMRVMVTGRLEQRSWETEDGERRSKVEIVAEELGPSLRFATAEVQRTERRTSGQPAEDADRRLDGGLDGQPSGEPAGAAGTPAAGG
jgi:single-strand DNA-binding protein